MINSAALWPLLEPQWKDPKKWWKELCAAKGKKDYDKRQTLKEAQDKREVARAVSTIGNKILPMFACKSFICAVKMR